MNTNLKLLQRDAAGVDKPSKASRIREALLFLCAAGKRQEKYGFCRILMEMCRKRRPEGGSDY